MALDPSIYAAFGVRPKSIADFDNEAMQREQNQLALLLARQKADEYQQGVAEKNALRAALGGGASLDTPEGQAAIYRAAPLLAGGVLKDRAALAKEQAGMAKDQAQARNYEAQAAGHSLDQRLKLHDRHLGALVAVQTPEDVLRWAQDGAESGALTPEQAQRTAATVRTLTSPQALAAWKSQAALGGLTVLDQLKRQAEQDRLAIEGQRVAETGRHNATSEQLRAAQIEQAARAAGLADARGRESLAVAQGNLGVSRERLALEAARAGGTDKPPAGYRWGEGGALVAIPGGPADPAVKAQTAKVQADKPPAEVRRMNIALRAMEQGLDAYEEKLRTFNVRSLDQLKPADRAAFDSLFADLLMQAKEAQALGALTGPDVAILERTLANPASLRGMAYGNEGLRAQIGAAREALKRRREAVAAEFGGGGDAPAPAGPGPIAQAAPAGVRRVATAAEYAALPSGTEYLDPDGKLRRKK